MGEYQGDSVVLKKMSLVGVTATKRQKMLNSFKGELAIMVRLRSPRVAQFYGVVTTNSTFLGLVMEYCPGGSLRDALNTDDEITSDRRRMWVSDVALGMSYLYSQGVEHRDLKALNVLLTHDLRCKVTDFGLSKCEDLKTTATATMGGGGLAGTPAFMAPELLEDNTFTEKSDVYSFAFVMFEIWSREQPWDGLQPAQIISKVLVKKARPEAPKMPDDLRKLMVRAWAHQPGARPSFKEIAAAVRVSTPRGAAPEGSSWGSGDTAQGTTKSMLGKWFAGGQESQGAPARAEGYRTKPPAKATPVVRKPAPAVSVGRGEAAAAAPAAHAPAPATVPATRRDDTETKAGEEVERKPIGRSSKPSPVEKPADKRAKALAKAPPNKQAKSAAKPAAHKPTTAAPAPAPAAAKKRGLFSKGRAAQPKPVVKSQPAPAAQHEAAETGPQTEELVDGNDDGTVAASSLWGRTLNIFRGAGALVAREDDTAEVALTEAQEDALRKVFNRVDISGDGHISVIEAIKALRGARSSTGIEADFARLLGLDDMTRIHQEDGTRDKLMLAFGALDADGDKKLSYEEFRRVVASAATTRDPVLALDP